MIELYSKKSFLIRVRYLTILFYIQYLRIIFPSSFLNVSFTKYLHSVIPEVQAKCVQKKNICAATWITESDVNIDPGGEIGLCCPL